MTLRRSERLAKKATNVSVSTSPPLSRPPKSRPRSKPSKNKEKSSFRFLDLPPELRNHVYRILLVKPAGERITLRGADRAQPSLLRVNKQLRGETASIYYSENTFTFHIHDVNGLDMLPFRKLQSRYRSPQVKGNFKTHFMGGANAANLLALIKACHDEPGLIDINVKECRERPLEKVTRAAFEVMKGMRWKTWAEIEVVLKAYFAALAALDRKWALNGE
jgi:hypothetical protein